MERWAPAETVGAHSYFGSRKCRTESRSRLRSEETRSEFTDLQQAQAGRSATPIGDLVEWGAPFDSAR